IPEAVQHASRLLDYYVARNEEGLARELINEISTTAGRSLPARFSLRAGDFLGKQGDIRQARAEDEHLLRNHPEEEGALRALLRPADLSARDGKASDAGAWLDRAARHPACTSEWRAQIERKRQKVG